MTTINPVTLNTNSTSTSNAVNGVSKLGINDFLTLMTSQLKYQDPTEPQKSSEFVAQLAQFSSVSGIQEMNGSMTSLLTEWRNAQAVSATSLVGHDVMLSASQAAIGAGQVVTGAVETPTGATNLQLVITDKSGQIVRQMTVPTQTPLSNFSWDGLDDGGNAVPAGEYGFKALANVSGKSESASILLNSKVNSVTINASDNSLTLNTGLGTATMADVRQIT